MIARGSFFVVDALAFPLPVTVIAELLGLPVADHDRFRGRADGLFPMQTDDPTDPDLDKRVSTAFGETSEYLTDVVRSRRAAPGDDLVSALVTAEVGGYRLDHEEAANVAALFLLAGHVTTTLLSGSAIRTFDEHPKMWAELCTAPGVVPGAVGEVLRLRLRSPGSALSPRARWASAELPGPPTPSSFRGCSPLIRLHVRSPRRSASSSAAVRAQVPSSLSSTGATSASASTCPP